MPRNAKHTGLAAAALMTVLAASSADAGDYSNSASYNAGYGMSSGQENQTVNPSLRDSNGNLTVVNGVFTSSSMSQMSGVQQMASSSINGGGVGSNGTGSAYGGATAIGNSLNVVTVGNNNTVVVNANQTNNGDQTANVSLNGK